MKFDTLADFDISVVNQIIEDMPTDFTEKHAGNLLNGLVYRLCKLNIQYKYFYMELMDMGLM